MVNDFGANGLLARHSQFYPPAGTLDRFNAYDPQGNTAEIVACKDGSGAATLLEVATHDAFGSRTANPATRSGLGMRAHAQSRSNLKNTPIKSAHFGSVALWTNGGRNCYNAAVPRFICAPQECERDGDYSRGMVEVWALGEGNPAPVWIEVMSAWPITMRPVSLQLPASALNPQRRATTRRLR